MSFQMQGMTELIRRIEQMGPRVDATVKEKALISGAEIFRDKAKENAPVRTGKLRDNIIISDVDANGIIHVGPNQQGTAFYGHILEYGAKHMSASPFLGPAYENNKQAVQDKMADVIKRELNL